MCSLNVWIILQRLLTCQQYVHKLALAQVQWNPKIPRYSHRYISSRMKITNLFLYLVFVYCIIKFNYAYISFFNLLCCLLWSALPTYFDGSNGGLRYLYPHEITQNKTAFIFKPKILSSEPQSILSNLSK